jgi:GNAT superfamily N-acetyltransferase
MSETLYTRGSSDAGYGYRKDRDAVGDKGGQGASALQKFLADQWEGSYYQLGLDAIGNAVGSAFTAVDEATSGAAAGYNAATATAAAARGGATTEEAQAAGEEARQATQEQQDEQERITGMRPGLLSTTLGGVEYGWSNFVARPASTGVMLTDPGAAPYRDGFQVEDIKEAYDRSAEVSFGRAVQSSPYNLLGRTLGFDNYDVWSDSDMEAADQNPFYNFFSGATDFALEVTPLSARPLRLSFLNKIGARGQQGVRSAEDLAIIRREYEQHRSWRNQEPVEPEMAGEGASPRQTGVGFLVDQTARQTDPDRIMESPILSGVQGIDKVKLSNIYARTDDPDTVFSLYMASKGDFQALQDLMERAPRDVWDLGEMNSAIYNDFINGKPFEPKPGDELSRVNQIFDSAADRDRYFVDVKRTLLDSDGNPRMGDTTMPGSLWVEKIKDATGRVRYAFKTSDYSGAPGWLRATTDGPIGGPATQFIQWAGSRQPLGRVTRSGARPNDVVQELDAWFNSVPVFRGTRKVTTGFDADGVPIQVPAQQFVREQKARLLQAQVDGGLEGAWRQMEDESITVMGLTMGYNANEAGDLLRRASEMRGEAKAVEDYLQQTGGYIFSENGDRVVFEPVTLSMLLDSFASTPLDEMFYYARINRPLASRTGKGVARTRGVATNLFDSVSKFFRSNVLLRLGYIPKNSIGEPWVASAIAHGTILTDKGLPTTMANFSKNRANNLRRVAYGVELDAKIKRALGNKDAKTRKQLRAELQQLIAQRESALSVIDLMQADLDAIKSGKVAPSLSPRIAARARSTMFEAHKIIRSIEASLDGQLPEWRQVVEPATVAQVSERLRFYRAVLGEDPNYLNDLRDELGSILARSYENTVLPSQRIQRQIDQIDSQIADMDKTLEKYSEDFNRPSVDKRDVSVARNQEDNIARGRDYQAIAMQRQRTSLLEQRDELLSEKRRIEETGVDAFADFPMSVSDRARAEYLETQIARLEGLQRQVNEFENPIDYNTVTEADLRARFLDPSIPKDARVVYKPGDEAASYGSPIIDHVEIYWRGQHSGKIDDKWEDLAAGIEWDRRTGEIGLVFVVDAHQRKGIASFLYHMAQKEARSRGNAPLKHSDDISKDGVAWSSALGDGSTKKPRQRISDSIRSTIDDLQEKYDTYLRDVDRDVDVSAEKRDAMIRELESVEAKIMQVQKSLGLKQAKIDRVKGDRAQLGAGRTDMTFNIGGEKFTVPGPLADDQYAMGAGWRAEVNAMQTARLNFDPSFNAGSLTSRLRDAGEVELIDRFDPRYFDELSYVANTYFRDDQLIGKILAGSTKAEVAKWLRTPEGKNYQKALGKDYLTPQQTVSDPVRSLNGDTTVRMMLEEASTLDEIWNIVHNYLPTPEARAAVAARPLSGSELSVLLADTEDLSRILSARGVWETYGGEGKARLREMGAMVNRGLDRLWMYAMGIPETRLSRNPFFEREFRRQMETRINIIREQAEAQGVRMTADEWNRQLQAIRQSSRRASLDVMEKTFYNIRRYSTPVYALRFLTSFPGATFNSVYRYGRFAWREPERMLTGSLLLGDMIQVLGVDAEGNPVDQDNIGDAVYLMVPGTQEQAGDAGVKIPIGSLASMFVDMPMLSWLGNMTVADIVRRNPKNDDRFREAFDKVGMGWYYDDLFPFGPDSNPLSTLFGGYQKDIWRGIRGPSDTDFIRTSVEFYSDNMAQWEKNGYDGDAPTFEQAIEDAHAYYWSTQLEIGPLTIPVPNPMSRGVLKNISPLSVFTSGPGQLWRDRWYAHREQYPNDTAEARRTFMEKHGDWARWYTYSSSEFTTYLPSSVDVYERVWEKYPDVVRDMVSVAGDDAISYINLLALDADTTFSPSVNNYLRNNPLPGDDVPVLRRIQPERFANIVRVNDGWDLYGKEVIKHEAEQVRLRELRDNAPTTEMADFYRDEMYREDQAWKAWLREGPLGQNEAWQISRNQGGKDQAANAALFLNKIIGDLDFAENEGKTKFWQRVKFFLGERERVLAEYDKLRNNEDKQNFKSDFRSWVRNEFLLTTPEFLPTYERYFEKEWE